MKIDKLKFTSLIFSAGAFVSVAVLVSTAQRN